jgi:hypothetical protein
MFRKLATFILSLGIDPRKIVSSVVGLVPFLFEYVSFLKKNRPSASTWPVEILPVLSDRSLPAGDATSIYFKQDLLVARAIYARGPRRHLDIGSRVDGFVGHLLSFMEVDMGDIREIQDSPEGLRFVRLDLAAPSIKLEKKYPSVSCLHALEHFGLGRYGDRIDPNGWKVGLANLVDLLDISGYLVVSVPVGRQRIEFNAHRVFDPKYFVSEAELLSLRLRTFTLIDDMKVVSKEASLDDAANCEYGCGIFEFEKS